MVWRNHSFFFPSFLDISTSLTEDFSKSLTEDLTLTSFFFMILLFYIFFLNNFLRLFTKIRNSFRTATLEVDPLVDRRDMSTQNHLHFS